MELYQNHPTSHCVVAERKPAERQPKTRGSRRKSRKSGDACTSSATRLRGERADSGTLQTGTWASGDPRPAPQPTVGGGRRTARGRGLAHVKVACSSPCPAVCAPGVDEDSTKRVGLSGSLGCKSGRRPALPASTFGCAGSLVSLAAALAVAPLLVSVRTKVREQTVVARATSSACREAAMALATRRGRRGRAGHPRGHMAQCQQFPLVQML